MKVSLNLVKKYTQINMPVSDLIDIIGSKLGAVEEVINLGQIYDGAVVVKVIECDKHMDADKLSVCKVDDNNVTEGIPRDEKGLIQVVCGAPNVKKDMFAVWLRPGSVIPSTSGKDQVILEAKDLRGVMSQGMLASSKELGLNDDHHGLLEIDKPANAGQKFSEIYELDDIIIDIENKMLTHRPDCFGILGIAREIAGITGLNFRSPDWYLGERSEIIDFQSNDLIRVENNIPDLVPEFLAQVINDIEIKPSDILTQSYLSRLGIRPINNIVDQTNYIMLLTGQPLHAYDYDKLKAIQPQADIPKIVVRRPNPDEHVELLNGKKITPAKDTILIATDNMAIGLGGVMGGSSTEIDHTTKNIVLECATFDMYSIRRTSMENGIFSEAVTRFNKGQSKLQNIHVLLKITQAILGVAGGKTITSIVSANKSTDKQPSFTVSPEFVNNLLGLEMNIDQMVKILTSVEINASIIDNQINIEPPFWRTDLEIKEDIAEEVGRLYGYDKLKLSLPIRSIKPASRNQTLDFKQRIRDLMSRVGGNETITYSFVHGNLIENTGQDKNLAFKLVSALSPDIQYYRMSLASSLLEKVHSNVKAGYPSFVLYEMSKVIERDFSDSDEPNLPEENHRLSLVLVDGAKTNSAFYQARTYLDFLATSLGIDLKILPFTDTSLDPKFNQTTKLFEPVRSGLVFCGDNFLGIIGEPKQSTKKHLKLPNFTSIIELDLHKLSSISVGRQYTKLSSYPVIDQDICFKIPSSVIYVDLYDMAVKLVSESFENTIFSLKPIDIFQGQDTTTKQITFRLKLNSYNKTLKNSDLQSLMNNFKQSVATEFNGEII